MIGRALGGMRLVLGLIATSAGATAPDDEADEQLWLKGRLLVATSSLDDPSFQKSVVYLIQHDQDGAMGLIVNRRVANGPLNRLLETLGHEVRGADDVQIALFEGGPVARGRGLLLHGDDYVGRDTIALGDGLALSAPETALDDLAAGKGPEASLLVLGHAGWAPGQLEQEIAQGAWHVVTADPALVLDQNVGTKWQRALDRRGIDL